MSKKFLYTDNDSLKSVAAQLYEGILLEQDISEGESLARENKNSTSSSVSHNSSSTARLRTIIGGDLTGSEGSSSSEQSISGESTSQIIKDSKKIAQDEYLYNIVQETLKEKEELKNEDNASQYDYLQFKEEFLFFDFDIIKNSIDHEFLLPLVFAEGFKMKEYEELVTQFNSTKKVDKQPENSSNIEAKKFRESFKEMQVFKSLNIISKHLDNILTNHFLLIDEKKKHLIIGDKNKLKLPAMSLTLNKKMNLDIFGLVVSNDNQIISSDFDEKDIKTDDMMPRLGTFALENYLISFFGFKNNSEYKIIHPISIEYSAD